MITASLITLGFMALLFLASPLLGTIRVQEPEEDMEDILTFVPADAMHFLYINFRNSFLKESFRDNLVTYIISNHSEEIETLFGPLDNTSYRLSQYMEYFASARIFSFYVAGSGDRGLFIMVLNKTESKREATEKSAQTTEKMGEEKFYCAGNSCIFFKGKMSMVGERDSLVEALETHSSNTSLQVQCSATDYVVYMHEPDTEALPGVNVSAEDVDTLLFCLNISEQSIYLIVESKTGELESDIQFEKDGNKFIMNKHITYGEVMEQFYRLFIYILTTGTLG